MFCKNGVPGNFVKFTEKHLWQSLFLNKVTDLRPATLLKKRLWHRCFLVNFAKFLRTPFIKEHLWWLLLLVDWCLYDGIITNQHLLKKSIMETLEKCVKSGQLIIKTPEDVIEVVLLSLFIFNFQLKLIYYISTSGTNQYLVKFRNPSLYWSAAGPYFHA